MPEIRKPAIKIKQGNRTLFLATFDVADFMGGEETLYSVDRLDVSKSSGKQRMLDETRVNSFASDIARAEKENQAFLPTSVFLATGGSIDYDDKSKTLSFDKERGDVCPFDVVDGQHRIKGLVKAAQDHPELKLNTFPISVVIAHEMDDDNRMVQFLTVNSKQQKVEGDVEQHIFKILAEKRIGGNLPYMPRWLKSKLEQDFDKALNIVLYLNDEPSSPWHNLVVLADTPKKDKKGRMIKQKTFVNEIKEHILHRDHPLGKREFILQREKLLKNYWLAIKEIFVSPSFHFSKSVAFKSVGAHFFLGISHSVFAQLKNEGKPFSVQNIRDCILSAKGHLGADEDIMQPEFWVSGGPGSGMNKGIARQKMHIFANALDEANAGGQV